MCVHNTVNWDLNWHLWVWFMWDHTLRKKRSYDVNEKMLFWKWVNFPKQILHINPFLPGLCKNYRDGLPRNLMEGCGMGQGGTHYSLVWIWIRGLDPGSFFFLSSLTLWNRKLMKGIKSTIMDLRWILMKKKECDMQVEFKCGFIRGTIWPWWRYTIYWEPI